MAGHVNQTSLVVLYRTAIENRIAHVVIGVMLGIAACISTAASIGHFWFRRALQFVRYGLAQAGDMPDAFDDGGQLPHRQRLTAAFVLQFAPRDR